MRATRFLLLMLIFFFNLLPRVKFEMRRKFACADPNWFSDCRVCDARVVTGWEYRADGVATAANQHIEIGHHPTSHADGCRINLDMTS